MIILVKILLACMGFNLLAKACRMTMATSIKQDVDEKVRKIREKMTVVEDYGMGDETNNKMYRGVCITLGIILGIIGLFAIYACFFII